MRDIIIQAIGAVGYSLLALSYFKKVKKQILLMQIFAYIFFVIHYYLLNGITGAVCNSIGLFALIRLIFGISIGTSFGIETVFAG